MSPSYHRWLPETAFKTCDSDLADVCRQWSVKWLAHGALRPMGIIAPTARAGSQPDRVRVLGRDLALIEVAGARAIIASAMLDRAVDMAASSPADVTMIDALAGGALDDLLARLARICRLPPESRWRDQEVSDHPLERPRACALTLDQRNAVLHVLVTTDLLVALRKNDVGVPPKRTSLVPISAALGDQDVTMSAVLGACTLRVADMAQLAPGDVLVLDRALGSALPLALDGQPVAAGRCVVERSDAGLHLELLDPFR